MTAQELTEKSQELKDNLSQMLVDFMAETGMCVEVDIWMNDINTLNGKEYIPEISVKTFIEIER